MGLEHIVLITELEDAFGIEIPNEDAETLATLGQIHTYLVARVAPEVSPDEVWERLAEILVEEHSLKREWIRPEAHLIRDLDSDSSHARRPNTGFRGQAAGHPAPFRFGDAACP